MKKKLLSMLLSTVLILSAMGISVPMAAMADTMMVVTVGADLTEEQKNMILKYFNVAGQSYTTITVTNDDEWSHLGSYMSRDIVGYKTISCALIRPMTSGGIQVKTANLTYVTSNMIASNLATAGVTNCEVLAAAPFQVSGTGALTGALMAYENLSGVTLDTAKKEAAAQEFATTYELGQTIGQQEAQQIVNDVKMQVINGTLEEDNSITQEEITEIVNNVVSNYTTNNTTNTTNNTTNTTNTTNITNNTTALSDANIAALQNLAVEIAKESYEQGTLDALAQIQKTLEGQTKTASTDATTQIEQSAASTTDTATADTTVSDAAATDTAATDTAATDTASTSADTQSAADQALAQDSLLMNTDESALAGTSSDGSVISSSTAEKTIDTEVATNLDTQLEEQKQEEVQQETAAQTDAAGIPEATDTTTIPEATDVTVIGGDSASTDTSNVNPDGASPVVAEDLPAAVEEPADVTTDPVAEVTNPAADGSADAANATVDGSADAANATVDGSADAADVTVDGSTDAANTTVDGSTDATDPMLDGTQDTADPEAGAEDGSGEDLAADAQNAVQITNADLESGNASLESFSTAGDGSQQASGAAAVSFVLPYEGLTPVTVGLRITNPDGSDAASFTYDVAQNNMVMLTSADSADVPAGSTMIIMMPADGSDISGQTNFAPAAGQTYNYNLNAEFTSADQTLNIQIVEYTPYSNSVSDRGFSVDGYSLNKSASEGATGTVLFPADGSASFATVEADAASVNINSGNPDVIPTGVTKDAGDSVSIMPDQSGLVTLTITYYASEEAAADPAAAVGTAEYTMYFA